MMPKSTLFHRGPCSPFRGESPNVPGALMLNAAGLKYCCNQWLFDPWRISNGWPVTSARSAKICAIELLFPSPPTMLNGSPECKLQMAESCQRPNAHFRGLASGESAGNCQTPNVDHICGKLRSEIPRFHPR